MKKNSVIYQIVTDRFDNLEGNLHSKVNDPNYNKNFGEYITLEPVSSYILSSSEKS